MTAEILRKSFPLSKITFLSMVDIDKVQLTIVVYPTVVNKVQVPIVQCRVFLDFQNGRKHRASLTYHVA